MRVKQRKLLKKILISSLCVGLLLPNSSFYSFAEEEQDEISEELEAEEETELATDTVTDESTEEGSEQEISDLDEYFLLNGSGVSVGEGEDGDIDRSLDDFDDLEDDSAISSNSEDDVAPLLGTSSMTTSSEGIAMICKWEGCRLTAYKVSSSDQYYTIGYGHYGSDVYAGETITQEQAVALLQSDVARFEKSLNNFLNKYSVSFNQHEFDAMISFSYNVGTSWLSDSTIRTYILNGLGNYSGEEITTAICMWSYSNHKYVQGLNNRRHDESKLFLKTCVYTAALELDGQIGFVFNLDIPSSIKSTVSYVSIYGDSVAAQTYSLDANATSATDRYQLTYYVPVKNLKDYIYIKIYNTSGSAIELTNGNINSGYGYRYSFSSYVTAAAKLSNDSLNSLLSALSAYCDASRVYFGLSTSSSSSSDASIDSSYQYAQYGLLTGLEYMGATLVLESNTSIRQYFKLSSGYSISNYSFYCNGTALTPVSENGVCYVELSNISAGDLDTIQTFKVADANGNKTYIYYSAFSYVYSCLQNSSNTNLRTLVSRLYEYNKAAETYLSSN